MDEFGSIENFKQTKFNKCVQQPKKLELLIESGNYIKRGHLYHFCINFTGIKILKDRLLMERIGKFRYGKFKLKTVLDELLEDDILKIIDADLNNAHIDLLRIKNLSNLNQIVLKFENEIANVSICFVSPHC